MQSTYIHFYKRLAHKGVYMAKGGADMNSLLNTTDPSQAVYDESAPVRSEHVFDYSETQIVRDGKTLTIMFPDEDKPIDISSH